jgi:hypothetical protein
MHRVGVYVCLRIYLIRWLRWPNRGANLPPKPDIGAIVIALHVVVYNLHLQTVDGLVVNSRKRGHRGQRGSRLYFFWPRRGCTDHAPK